MTFLACRSSTDSVQGHPGHSLTAIYELSIRAVSNKREVKCYAEAETVPLVEISEDWEGLRILLKKNLPEVTPDTLKDFKTKNSVSSRLSLDVKSNPSFVTVRDDEKRRIDEGGWAEFYSQHPEAEGICRVSHVAFSTNGKSSLVYLHVQRSYNAGESFFIDLKSEGDSWSVRRKYKYSSN